MLSANDLFHEKHNHENKILSEMNENTQVTVFYFHAVY